MVGQLKDEVVGGDDSKRVEELKKQVESMNMVFKTTNQIFMTVYNAIKEPFDLEDLNSKDSLGTVLEGLEKIITGMSKKTQQLQQ